MRQGVILVNVGLKLLTKMYIVLLDPEIGSFGGFLVLAVACSDVILNCDRGGTLC